MDRRHLLEVAGQLRPLAVRDYAESRGWILLHGPQRRAWVFNHPVRELRQLHVPIDSDSTDFADAMFEVALRIADLDERDVESVLSDLLHPDADILRIRIASPDSVGGDVSLTEDVDLREGARRALLAAASSVVNPATHHARMSRSQAEQFLGTCKSGQTEIGSYVVKIICPLFALDDVSMPDDTMPFARQTTKLLIGATHSLVTAIEQDEVDEFLEKDSVHPTVSSNLCDALLRMQPENPKGRMEMRMAWAAVPDISIPDGVATRVSIPNEYFRRVEDVYDHLRGIVNKDEAKSFYGTVESLQGDVGQDGNRSGEVVLALMSDDGETIRARANLGSRNYHVAVRAHEAGRGFVSLKGVYRPGIRVGRIEEISAFEYLQA